MFGQAGVDADNPKPAQITLFELPADVGILTGVEIGLLGDFVKPTLGHPHALGAG